jgi:hypothetical protein
MKRNELIIRALHDAIDWQDSLIDCLKDCTNASDVKAREWSENLVAAYRKLYQKMSGRPFDPPPYTGETVSIYDLMKQPKEKR